MKLCFAALNAQYIHTNLAVRTLRDYLSDKCDLESDIVEFTINHPSQLVLRSLFEKSPNIVVFSCYIWNMELIKSLAADLRQILPDCKILCGGPEVEAEPETFLRENTAVDAVLRGEGEIALQDLVECLRDKKRAWGEVRSLVYRSGDGIVSNPPAPLVDLAELRRFPYQLESCGTQICYYESMRGCPFRCEYCLSCQNTGVRFRPLALVFSHLDEFLRRRVKIVKFVDRTFNCNAKHAMAIWDYLIRHDNGYTTFHFEMCATLISDSMLALISRARKGLFQFEIGVQSTNDAVLTEIRRTERFSQISARVQKLAELKNCHIHLDLIAGLPLEDYESFRTSFNEVYSLAPQQFQLGFLKVLRGSAIYQKVKTHGIRYQTHAPYEVLCTNALTHAQLLKLKNVEEIVELYYNSGRFAHLLREVTGYFPTPFDFFQSFGDFYFAHGYHLAPHAKLDYYSILREFLISCGFAPGDHFSWLAKLDLLQNDNIKKFPDWLQLDLTTPYRDAFLEWINSPGRIEQYLPEYRGENEKYLLKAAHFEVFPFDVTNTSLPNVKTAVLFNYRRRTLTGQSDIVKIPLDL